MTDVLRVARRFSHTMLIHLSDALSVPDGGFSIQAATCEEVRAGYAVAIFPEFEYRTDGPITPDHIARFYMRHTNTLLHPDVVLGGWRSPTDGVAFLDISLVLNDRDRALTIARATGQRAVWDFAVRSSITVAHVVQPRRVKTPDEPRR